MLRSKINFRTHQEEKEKKKKKRRLPPLKSVHKMLPPCKIQEHDTWSPKHEEGKSTEETWPSWHVSRWENISIFIYMWIYIYIYTHTHIYEYIYELNINFTQTRYKGKEN